MQRNVKIILQLHLLVVAIISTIPTSAMNRTKVLVIPAVRSCTIRPADIMRPQHLTPIYQARGFAISSAHNQGHPQSLTEQYNAYDRRSIACGIAGNVAVGAFAIAEIMDRNKKVNDH